MSGVFSVLFKERCQSVLCVISESLLFVLIYTVSQKVLMVHFWRRFSKIVFSSGNTMELIVCLSLLKRPKTDNFCKYKIRLPWIPYSAEELLFSSPVLNYTDIILPTGLLVVKSPWPAPVVVNFLKAENFSKNRKQQLKGGTHLTLAREKGPLIELNCHWCTVQLATPVTIPRETTERCMPGNAVIMLIFQVKRINVSPKNKPCHFFLFF